MDGALLGQKRYLAALMDAARPSQAACANQLAALAREIALAEAATSTVAYRAASGELFELSRGLWLDRVVGHARIAAAVDDPWAVAALRVEIDATLAAQNASDFVERLVASSAVSASIRTPGGEAVSAYARLLGAVVRARVETRPVERATAMAEAVSAKRRLLVLDASFDPRALASRYRWRTPWTGSGLIALASWIGEIGGASSEHRAVPPDRASELLAIERAAATWRTRLNDRPTSTPTCAVAGEVSIADVVAPYVHLAKLTGDSPEVTAIRTAAAAMITAASVQPTPQDVLAAWAEAGLPVALARAPIEAGLTRILARLQVWPEPLLAQHARMLASDLSAARTTTEVDLISVHAEACLLVEADWNRVLAAGLLAPLRSTFIAAWENTALAQRGIAAAWAVARQLAGSGADLDDLPWVAAFLRNVIIRYGAGDTSTLGAGEGEAGADVLGEARTAIAAARAAGALGVLEPTALRTWLRSHWGIPPASVPHHVARWDQCVALSELRADTVTLARPRLRLTEGRIELGDS